MVLSFKRMLPAGHKHCANKTGRILFVSLSALLEDNDVPGTEGNIDTVIGDT